MIRHIVLFKLKKELPAAERAAAMNAFKRGIEALCGQIAEIRAVEVGFNCNPDETWDICLVGDFDTPEDVRTYAADARHLAVAGALKPFVESRGCVDYER